MPFDINEKALKFAAAGFALVNARTDRQLDQVGRVYDIPRRHGESNDNYAQRMVDEVNEKSSPEMKMLPLAALEKIATILRPTCWKKILEGVL